MSLICNEEFNSLILEPVLVACKTVADTSELFARAFKLIDMFAYKKVKISSKKQKGNSIGVIAPSKSAYSQMKPGLLAKTAFRNVIESGKLTKQEVDDLQDKSYSKKTFNVGYPVLATNRDPARYYSDPVSVNGKDYYICNDWYEHNKQALIDWIEKHS